jgi:hypothetical protein
MLVWEKAVAEALWVLWGKSTVVRQEAAEVVVLGS